MTSGASLRVMDVGCGDAVAPGLEDRRNARFVAVLRPPCVVLTHGVLVRDDAELSAPRVPGDRLEAEVLERERVRRRSDDELARERVLGELSDLVRRHADPVDVGGASALREFEDADLHADHEVVALKRHRVEW